MRRLLVLLPLTLVLACLPTAWAGPQVPEVAPSELPVAGTCAPLPSENVTWLTIGEVDWYRIDGDSADVRGEKLYEVLMARSRRAVEAGRRHDVWIVADRSRLWGQVVQVLALCQRTGIFRVGLQVQAESREGVMGFPLFLPAPGAEASPSGSIAREMKVRIEKPAPSPLRDAPPQQGSHPDNLYVAARRAVEQFGPVVAEASIRRGITVQHAVRVIDLLYRAGCAAVKFPYLVMRRPKTESVVQIWVEDRLLDATSDQPVEIPPIGARKSPWPDSGAAQPGALGLALEPIPTGRRAPTARQVLPLDNHAATGQEVPAAAFQASSEIMGDWATRLSNGLQAVMRPESPLFPAPLLVKSRRQGMGVDEFFGPARRAFPVTDAVHVATVRVQAYLFRENLIVGRIDLTVDLSGGEPGIVFGRWVGGPYPTQQVRLPPFLTDPYAGGVPGHVRVWVEGTLAAGRLRGATALPMVPEADVLAELPTVAHAGVRQALAGRSASLENLVGWLRATPFDRLFIEAAEGSAGVHARGRVLGVIRFELKPEGGELALSTLTARAAPR